MNVLIVSQVYWPDSTAVSQIVTDMAEDLVVRGHTVSVISSSRQYEHPENRFPATETHKGVHIERLSQTSFGKGKIVGRLVDFFSFNASLLLRLLSVKKREHHVLIGLTVPPMVSFVSGIVARRKGIKFVYWAMDLQPELSIAAGYMKADSAVAGVMTRVGDSIYRHADLIIALDRFMADHIVGRGGERSRIRIVPVWPVATAAYTGSRLENPFRKAHELGDRFIVMYSGNHSVYNPLETVLQAALLLRSDPRFLFVFIGGGVRKKDVSEFKATHSLENIRQFHLQDRATIHESLAAADLHVVSLGETCSGFTHPSKVYGILSTGRPLLSVGPRQSYVSDLLTKCPGNLQVAHGEADLLADRLRAFAALSQHERDRIGAMNQRYAADHLTRERLSGQVVEAVESVGPEA